MLQLGSTTRLVQLGSASFTARRLHSSNSAYSTRFDIFDINYYVLDPPKAEFDLV